MSRTATITKQEIINAAFKITRKEGFEQITSRKLAAAAGCSTQPIFRIYNGMDELKKDVYEKATVYYEDYYKDFLKTHETPFVDLGLAYIGFAQKYPHLFSLLFATAHDGYGRSMYDLVNGSDENVVKEVSKAREMGAQNAEQLFMQMWIFIHGAGCMALTGDYDLEYDDSVAMLTAAYNSFNK